MDYLLIIISAIFVNNIVLAQFLGICPFLGVSKNLSTTFGMSAAVMFVMTLSTIITWMIQHYLLNPLNLAFLQTIVFILVIATLVQMVEIMLKKVSPVLYQALGIFLPLITTNCAILGIAILTIQKDYGLFDGVIFAVGHSLGFALALIMFASLREHLSLMQVPKGMRGIPIALVVAGILSLAFMGFVGLVK